MISPWGEVVATTNENPGIVHATLDMNRVVEVRKSVPTSTQKRADLYALSDFSASKL